MLFRTAAKLFGENLLGVVLTGMGKDGLEGCREIKHHEGLVYAQDEETSVAWGMPRAVIKSGIADRVVPLPEMAHAIMSIVNAHKVREAREMVPT